MNRERPAPNTARSGPYPPRATRFTAYLMAAGASLVTVAIILRPEEAFSASLDGLRVWWEIVFPALLPFFIASEVLMGLGVVHFTGALMEPLMRPIFDVPGAGAFAFAMGLASGYPIGARITARLRRDGLCSRIEAERLLCFTNTADPLFMVGAVAVGMFAMPRLGPVLAAAHYLSAVAVGIALRNWGGRRRHPQEGARTASHPRQTRGRGTSILRKAVDDLITARTSDARPFGKVFGDSVRDSVLTLLTIGGFIIMFSVIIKVLSVLGALTWLEALAAAALERVGCPGTLSRAVISGMLEITIGTEAAAKASAPVLHRAMVASAIIAWSGLSVHAQACAMVEGTDIRMAPYVLARTVQGAIAALLTLAIVVAAPGFAPSAAPAAAGSYLARGNLWPVAGALALSRAGVAAFTLCLLVCGALLVRLASSPQVIAFRVGRGLRLGRRPRCRLRSRPGPHLRP